MEYIIASRLSQELWVLLPSCIKAFHDYGWQCNASNAANYGWQIMDSPPWLRISDCLPNKPTSTYLCKPSNSKEQERQRQITSCPCEGLFNCLRFNRTWAAIFCTVIYWLQNSTACWCGVVFWCYSFLFFIQTSMGGSAAFPNYMAFQITRANKCIAEERECNLSSWTPFIAASFRPCYRRRKVKVDQTKVLSLCRPCMHCRVVFGEI